MAFIYTNGKCILHLSSVLKANTNPVSISYQLSASSICLTAKGWQLGA